MIKKNKCDKCLAIQNKSMNSNTINVSICLLDETNCDIEMDVSSVFTF